METAKLHDLGLASVAYALAPKSSFSSKVVSVIGVINSVAKYSIIGLALAAFAWWCLSLRSTTPPTYFRATVTGPAYLSDHISFFDNSAYHRMGVVTVEAGTRAIMTDRLDGNECLVAYSAKVLKVDLDTKYLYSWVQTECANIRP
jgi:hypothetical protein